MWGMVEISNYYHNLFRIDKSEKKKKNQTKSDQIRSKFEKNEKYYFKIMNNHKKIFMLITL